MQFLSRYFESKGHQCRILPAAKVKAFLNLDKNDKIDATGIFKAMLSSVESIPAKSVENRKCKQFPTKLEATN